MHTARRDDLRGLTADLLHARLVLGRSSACELVLGAARLRL